MEESIDEQASAMSAMSSFGFMYVGYCIVLDKAHNKLTKERSL